MNEFLNIIIGAPLYVWPIFFYLLFIGVRSLNKRIIYLPKLFIVPVVLLSTKYEAILSEESLVFVFAIVIGAIIGFFVHLNTDIKIIKNSKSVEVPGSYLTLVLLSAFFLFKCLFGYLQAIRSDLAFEYSSIEIIVSGLFSGYYLGCTVCYTYRYLNAENYK